VETQEKSEKQEKQSPLPSITVPKGGGAIAGIGEKFSVNAVTGTAGATIPLPFSPGRNGFSPQLGLAYDSGAGNSPFGLGWSLSLSSISRKTAKGLPQYNDAEESDVFLMAGAEDLVPFLEQDDVTGEWKPKLPPGEPGFEIKCYRPRTEGTFARIERWTKTQTVETHWKITSKDNVTSIYGRSSAARIAHPSDPLKVFQWLLEESRDNRGNIIAYEYRSENADGVDGSLPFEHFRIEEGKSFSQKYIKTIRYGNRVPDVAGQWLFTTVFDYGEHDPVNPQPEEHLHVGRFWPVRKDPFSSGLSGFDLRTYRLCLRVLLYHQFDELGAEPVLVRSTDFVYESGNVFSLLLEVNQTGYTRKSDGYERKSTPPVTYSYSVPSYSNEIRTLSPESLEHLPYGVDDANYSWVDLNGEGIDGILTEQGGAWFYKTNNGNGEFTPARKLTEQPSLAGQRPVLQDIDSDGNKELMVMSADVSGYFSRSEEQWENFVPFEQMPNISFNDPNLRFVDLDGDGFADILITEDDVLRWFPSKAKGGYGPSRATSKPIDEQAGPAIVFVDAEQTIYLADMSGDGLVDIVRIRNKAICYWANYGYGQFGPKVTMSNAPVFDYADSFNQSQIRLADIDGSGTTDILYIANDHVSYWINESGNRWSEERTIAPFPEANNLTHVRLADIMGTGLPCLVWSSPLPNDAGHQLKYIDLFGGVKPYLMRVVDNNMGKRDVVHYTSSTRFYLEDKKSGNPWITRLPFPVHVVERTESFDLIAGAKIASTYRYHHGYYDGKEREFRGFGMVEQFDAEAFGDVPVEANTTPEIYFVPPVHTKTWYHTGATFNENISAQYKSEYFSGDPGAYHLPDSGLVDVNHADAKAVREACRTLRGQVLRQEVYSKDGTSKETIPYTAAESNFKVRQLQPVHGQRHGVFFVVPNETLSYSYERECDDPRVSHDVVLCTDRYGFPVRSAQVVYPRRPGKSDHAEQNQLHIVLSETELLHHDDEREHDDYLLGIPLEQKSFEVTGVFPGGLYFDTETLRGNIAQATPLAFHETPAGQDPQKRLLSWSKNLYWNELRTASIDFGNAAWPLLLHHSEAAVFTPQLIESVFDNGNQHAGDAGYMLRDEYWWNPGSVVEYSGPFLQPVAVTDPYGNRSVVTYDPYELLAVKSQDALMNSTQSEIDYRTLSPRAVTDPNGSVSEALTDPLGMVMAVSIRGTEASTGTGQRPAQKGDRPLSEYVVQQIDGALALELIIASPQAFLQKATSFYYYDLHAWMNRREPPQFVSLMREKHVSDENGIASPVHISLGYSDGWGRSVQLKTNVEPGDAFTRDASGKLILGTDGKPAKSHCENRWLSSGRSVFNNKQKPVRQYEPFYTSTFRYETETELVHFGISPLIHYDPMLRVIRTDLPKGFFSKVEFSSWESRTYDVNDTILESEYYNAVVRDGTLVVDAHEFEALKKTKKHADTPAIAYLDSFGRPFMGVVMPEKDVHHVSYTAFNITGKPVALTDARQFELNKSRPPEDRIHNFRYVYDMSGTALRSEGVDNGIVRGLVNVAGQPHLTINAKQFVTTARYDQLHRPVEIYCTGPGMAKTVVERMIYGEMLQSSEATAIGNVRGKLIRQYDSSGKNSIDRISFKGETLRSTKWFVTLDAESSSPLEAASDGRLETKGFISRTTYDALGRATETVAPDGSIAKPVFNFSGQLKKVSVNLRGAASATDYVTDLVYNDKGQRSCIYYKNGTRTKYTYEPLTFRLTSLCTTRIKTGGALEKLQELFYFYDPAGNITRICDKAQQVLFYDGEVVKPENSFVYDALYQLIEAHGREHAGQNAPYNQFDSERVMRLPGKGDGAAMRRYCQKFTYDAAGNKTEVNHRSGINTWTRILSVDENSNRLLRTWLGEHLNEEEFTYDVSGSMHKISSADILSWNYKGEVAALARGTMNARYTYSGGQRVRKVVESDGVRKVRYYLGSFEVYQEYQLSSAGAELMLQRESLHISDGEERVVLVETKTFENEKTFSETLHRYQYGNHLGSASLELDAGARIISYEEYYPYGCTSYQSVRSGNEVPDKRYRYTGMERDDESGLNYHSARYYAPWMGRWISADPAGTVDGLNLYRYARGNPICLLDRNGQNPHIKVEEVERYGIKVKSVTIELDVKVMNFVPGGRFDNPESIREFARDLELMLEEQYSGHGDGYIWKMKANVQVLEDFQDVDEDDHVIILTNTKHMELFGIASGQIGYVDHSWTPFRNKVWTAAHELGHTMGLKDTDGGIMSGSDEIGVPELEKIIAYNKEVTARRYNYKIARSETLLKNPGRDPLEVELEMIQRRVHNGYSGPRKMQLFQESAYTLRKDADGFIFKAPFLHDNSADYDSEIIIELIKKSPLFLRRKEEFLRKQGRFFPGRGGVPPVKVEPYKK